jgi:hypothetical protein
MHSNSNDLDRDYFLLGKRKIEEEEFDLTPNKRQKLDDEEILEDMETVKDTIISITDSIIKIVNKNDDIEENKNKLKETNELLAEKYLRNAQLCEQIGDKQNMIKQYFELLKYSNNHGAAAKIGDYYLEKKPYIAIHYYHTERCNGNELLGSIKLVIFFEHYHDQEMYERMLEAIIKKFNYKPAIERLIRYYIIINNTEKLKYYINLSNSL